MPSKGASLKSATTTYIVDKPLGAGGAGEVFLVRDDAGVSYAAKVLRVGLSSQKLRRFKNELMFGFRENHRNLIKVLDFGRSEAGESFYVMPLASETLRKMMDKGIPEDSRLPLFVELLDGVEAAHLKGVIHRDLKPENILIESGQAKVADFGIAHFEEDLLHTPVETLPSDRLANFEYAAPEQRRPSQAVDQRADIYSLGLILVELFTGEVPHGADPTTITSVAPQFSYLDEIANSMRQNSPDKRPSSIAEVKNLLIARGNDFVRQQRIDALQRTVIPASEISDPLIDDPIRLEDVDYQNGQLIFTMSRVPSSRWQQHFRNMGSFSSVMGSGPEYFGFVDKTARVSATEHTAQMVVNHFKNYIRTTNELYAHSLRNQIAQEEESRRRQLREALAREMREQEVRNRVKSNLKF